MTKGGLGVAFFSPFDNSRYFLPWRPIRVSPIAIHRFFSARIRPGSRTCANLAEPAHAADPQARAVQPS